MKRSQPNRNPIHHKKRTRIEWIGGIASFHAYITGKGEPYLPEILIWLGADLAILGTQIGKSGEVLQLASDSLRSTIEQPESGRPHQPTHLRVATPELADALRDKFPELEVVVAPTPELDKLLALMREEMGDNDTSEASYLSTEVSADAMASCFKAAAAFFRAKPWKIVPDDQTLFSVTSEQLGLRDAVVSVIGQFGENFGFLLFSDFNDFSAFCCAAAGEAKRDETPDLPPHIVLNFQRGAALATTLRKEIAEHHWEVAGPNAYPWLVSVDKNLVVRPMRRKEVSTIETIAFALTDVLVNQKKALQAAWSGGKPVSRTLSISTQTEKIKITLRTPYRRALSAHNQPQNTLTKLAALTQAGDEIDPEAREPLEDDLMRQFADSSEADGLVNIFSCRFVFDLAAGYFGQTIGTLTASELRKIVFELFPRKISINASEAQAIVGELRAFYKFLKRVFKLKQADDCLKVIGGNAIKTLEVALSDSSNFGMAKSFLMAGAEAGFDMESADGIQAWMQSVQESVHSPSTIYSGFDSLQPLPQKARPAKSKSKSKSKGKGKSGHKAQKNNK